MIRPNSVSMMMIIIIINEIRSRLATKVYNYYCINAPKKYNNFFLDTLFIAIYLFYHHHHHHINNEVKSELLLFFSFLFFFRWLFMLLLIMIIIIIMITIIILSIYTHYLLSLLYCFSMKWRIFFSFFFRTEK